MLSQAKTGPGDSKKTIEKFDETWNQPIEGILQAFLEGHDHGLTQLCIRLEGLLLPDTLRAAISGGESKEEASPLTANKTVLLGIVNYIGNKPHEAMACFKKAAEQNNPLALKYCAEECLSERFYGEKDTEEAILYFHQAIKGPRSVVTLNLLGMMYQKALGFPTDLEKAVDYFQQAAAQGDPTALCKIGDMHLQGSGLEKSPEMAVQLFYEAAIRGSSIALCRLGEMYLQGLGVEKNWEIAREYATRAAEIGNPMGLFTLAKCCEHDLDFGMAFIHYESAKSILLNNPTYLLDNAMVAIATAKPIEIIRQVDINFMLKLLLKPIAKNGIIKLIPLNMIYNAQINAATETRPCLTDRYDHLAIEEPDQFDKLAMNDPWEKVASGLTAPTLWKVQIRQEIYLSRLKSEIEDVFFPRLNGMQGSIDLLICSYLIHESYLQRKEFDREESFLRKALAPHIEEKKSASATQESKAPLPPVVSVDQDSARKIIRLLDELGKTTFTREEKSKKLHEALKVEVSADKKLLPSKPTQAYKTVLEKPDFQRRSKVSKIGLFEPIPYTKIINLLATKDIFQFLRK